MRSDYTFVAATYLDLMRAEADYEALRRLHVGTESLDCFDCVTFGRKASGEERFDQVDAGCGKNGVTDGVSWSLAAGLTLALFPSVGSDIPASRVMEREILGAVAGVLGGALGRTNLHDFGALLDSAAAGLVAATTSAGEPGVRSAFSHAQSLRSRSVSIDGDAIEQAVRLIAARYR